ncbi:MAG: hypothetical protein BWX88_01558 [Planctomycetes bacterium ADurb.Bin126]|nr:MAG: hypothetical protein BWX88_01558 [Planctomycetes bacterium ADurb.Bin126]
MFEDLSHQGLYGGRKNGANPGKKGLFGRFA